MSRTTVVTSREIISALEDFVETQNNLIIEFQQQYHFLSDDASLLKQPKSGLLSAMEQEWKFQKHGAGILFEGDESGKIIDAHTGIISNKQAFDSWRLAEYFESINCDRVFWASNPYLAKVDDDLDRLLKQLEQANIVKLVSGRYNLYELVRS